MPENEKPEKLDESLDEKSSDEDIFGPEFEQYIEKEKKKKKVQTGIVSVEDQEKAKESLKGAGFGKTNFTSHKQGFESNSTGRLAETRSAGQEALRTRQSRYPRDCYCPKTSDGKGRNSAKHNQKSRPDD